MKTRVKKLLDLRTDTPEFLEALDALASIQVDSQRRDARRHLRYDLEDRSLKLIENFIAEGTKVQDALRSVRLVVSDIEKECSKALSDLDSAEKATTRFVEESSALREARKEAEQRAETVSAFLQRFQLTPKELEALNKTTNPDFEFFKALERVRKIRDECAELLSGAHQSTGLEIFEQMAAHQNRAQDVVYAWIKQECMSNVCDLESESKRKLYSRAFGEFKTGSPAYYSHAVELVSKARRIEVAKKFSVAVSQKSLDHVVHDPIRCLSDLLTSLHEVCAEERDLYQTVFHSAVGVSRLPLLNEDGEELTDIPNSNRLDPTEQQESLERALSGISGTFRMKGAQYVDSLQDSVSCFRATQILDFYSETLFSFFPLASTNTEEDNPLIVVRQLKEEATWKFFKLVEEKSAELQISAKTRALPGSDLSASFEVLELVRCLRDILTSIRDHSSLSKNPNATSEETEKALKAFVGPIRALVQAADQTISSSADSCVFAVNNLSALQAVLTLHEFTASIVEDLTFEIGEKIDILARIRSDAALARSGLSQAIQILDRVDPANHSRLSEQPGLRVEQIKSIFDAFYRDLSGSLVMPEFDRIDAPKFRHQARHSTCNLILTAHNKLYDAVLVGGYADTSFLTYTKTQVADLLFI